MTISMPAAPGFTACSFRLQPNTQAFTSPLNRATQRLSLDGDRWVATYSLPAMTRARAADWHAFFLKLRGRANAFYAYDPDGRTPRGAGTGTPLVKGAGQAGTTLLIDGCTPGVAGWLLAGDYFSVNGELKQLTAAADSDGSGDATLTFQPPLRNAPADNAPLTLTDASCLMALIDDDQGTRQTGVRQGVYEPTAFSAYEVFS